VEPTCPSGADEWRFTSLMRRPLAVAAVLLASAALIAHASVVATTCVWALATLERRPPNADPLAAPEAGVAVRGPVALILMGGAANLAPAACLLAYLVRREIVSRRCRVRLDGCSLEFWGARGLSRRVGLDAIRSFAVAPAPGCWPLDRVYAVGTEEGRYVVWGCLDGAGGFVAALVAAARLSRQEHGWPWIRYRARGQ